MGVPSASLLARTFNIWIKATLKYRYALLPQIKLREKKTPIGTMARR
jgi:hypothetical protein